MEVYQVDEDELSQVPASELATEQELEEHLIKSRGAVIGDVELMYIDRQGTPDEGGIFDILAVDRNGDIVIVELKRDKTPRDIVAQALEYASGLRNDEYATLNNRFREFLRTHGHRADENGDEIPSLQEEHASYFDREEDPVPERAFNTDQRLVLVGTEFRTVSLNMADFLRDHGIDVICVEYQSFASEDEDVQLLTTQSIRRPLSTEPTGTSSDESETESDQIKREFWENVAEEIASRADTPLKPVNPGTSYARNQSTPRSDIKIRLTINTMEQRVYAMLLIRDDRALYDRLKSAQEEIESQFEEKLEWIPHEETMGEKERCKIRISRGIDIDQRTDWDEAVEWIVNRGEQFHAVFADRLTQRN